MQIKKRLLVGGVCGALLIGTMVPALAATVHYNDGSTVGGRHPNAIMSSCMALANSSVSASQEMCRSAARRIILSSTSVKLLT